MTACTVSRCVLPLQLNLSICNAGSERNWSTFRRIWSDDRNRLLAGRVALLVYCHYNQRVLNRTYGNWACVDWDRFVDALEQEDPIKAPAGHAALAVPGAYSYHPSFHSNQIKSSSQLQLCIHSCAHAGVEPVSEDEEESDGDDSGQENVTPTSEEVAACAAEEAMMEMTDNGPYQPVL